MENQIPYVTASLNDSEMVFKDRILYMVNIRKLRKGILPGILVTLLLAVIFIALGIFSIDGVAGIFTVLFGSVFVVAIVILALRPSAKAQKVVRDLLEVVREAK